MVRFLLALTAVLALAAAASAAHRSLFGIRDSGRIRERVVVRDRHVERSAILNRVRGGSGCAGIQAGGCSGTVSAPRSVAGGCSGYVGPALAAPVAPKAIPMPMVPHKK